MALFGEAQVADYDHHEELAFRLWEQQLTSPPAQINRAPAESVAAASTLVRQRYLRAEEFVIGLIGVALLRLSAADGLSAADRTRLASPLVHRLREFVWQLDGVPFSDDGWEVLDSRAGYGRWAASYDLASAALVAVEEPPVLALLDNLPPGPVVDAACGTGRYAAHLARKAGRSSASTLPLRCWPSPKPGFQQAASWSATSAPYRWQPPAWLERSPGLRSPASATSS
jgi:SAM-dependent methyltransferase